jgi:4-amino-4-deoxy-L-arabinose transferase-like glycosyltransferase
MTGLKLPVFFRKDIFLIILLWLLLTAINIDKAFHIDDTFHLEAGQWIAENPLKPMSGHINWADDPTPMYTHNQPVLFFYLVAFTSFLFGMGEIQLHLMESVFTFLVLYYFYKTAVFLRMKRPRLLLIFLAFCPAFIINQNVMVDVPVLSLILISTYCLLKSGKEQQLLYYCLSALCIGLGLLIKYSLLPLLVVILLVLLVRRDFKYLPVLFIPVLMLAGWSSWNLQEFCSVHIFNRPRSEFHPVRIIEFIACVGAVSPLSICLIPKGFSALKWLSFCFFFAVIFYGLFVWAGVIEIHIFGQLLNYLFISNGLLIVFALVFDAVKHGQLSGLRDFINSNTFILWLTIGALASFMVLFAPFMATRHILLIIPFLLLVSSPIMEHAAKLLVQVAVAITVILGLVLGISDWKTADYYREMAGVIEIPQNQTVWAAGHWGWQWYALKNQMKIYGTQTSEVKEGDYLVYPRDIVRQTINPALKLSLVDKKWKDADLLTFVSGSRLASLYSSSIHNPVWRFSMSPVDTIYVFKVDRIELTNP